MRIAEHLVTSVIPDVRVRQWVLTLPYTLRYRAAFDHILAGGAGPKRRPNTAWTNLMKKSFGLDVLA